MSVNKRQLDQAFVDLGSTYGGLKEDYFALLYLAEQFQRPPETLTRYVAFGGNDYGLDAFYIDRELRNLYLYQFKWSDNHALFRSSLQRLISDGMDRIFGNPHQDPRVNQFITELKSALDENQAVIDRVYVHFVFNGETDKAEQSAVLQSLGEDLESKKHLLDEYFGKNVQLTLQYISNRGGRGGTIIAKRTREYSIAFENNLTASSGGDENLHVGFIHLIDLHKMHKEMGSRLFSRNIRFGLSPEKSPNRAIRQALARIVLQEGDPASVFVFNHNGITLAAEKVHFENGRCAITEPRILNGAQTITSLAKFLEDHQDHPALEANKARLNEIRVLAKIIAHASEDFIVNVTVCNNRQNPVEPWHLRASDKIQLQLQDKFADDLGIFYERAEGAFKALTDAELEELELELQSKAVTIKRLAQTFLASQGELDKMSRLPDVFENENVYTQTFREGYLRSDTRRIVLAYKIHFHLRRIVQEIVDRGPTKYEYLVRARNLVWALLIQALLNDDHLSQWLEDYGQTLVMEANYSNILKGLAAGKVRSIVKDGLSDDRSRQMLAEEKYSILRTKATYQRCMEAAYDKYGWTKRPL
jgi:hypothetical protein